MEQFSLRWNSYPSQITEAFDCLRNEEDLVDVTLSCEGKQLSAHKILLSACSPYLHGIFKVNPCQHPVIIFQNMKFSNLEAIINYIYRGEVSVDQDQLESFLAASELLEVKGLSAEPTVAEEMLKEKASIPIKTNLSAMKSKHARSKSPETSASPTRSSKRRKSTKLPRNGDLVETESSSQSLPITVKEEKEDSVNMDDVAYEDDEDADPTFGLDDLSDSACSTAEDPLATTDNTISEDIKPTMEKNYVKGGLPSENKPAGSGAAVTAKYQKLARPRIAAKLAKMKRLSVHLAAKSKLKKKIEPSRRLVVHCQEKKSVSTKSPSKSKVHIPKGLSVTVSQTSAQPGGAECVVTRSEDAKTPVGEELYPGVPEEQQDHVSSQSQPDEAEEAPALSSEVFPLQEEIKEPEFDYYGCETCKADARPCDRFSFTHKCPICPCMCFCTHLLKDHMKYIHGWFNIQRKFNQF